MAFTPISNEFIQHAADASGTSASGYFLKLYASGTNTPISAALDSGGSTLVAKVELDSLGYAKNSSGGATAVFIDQTYRLVLYVNATDADANTFANAVQDIDGIPQLSTINTVAENVKNFATLAAAVADVNLVNGDALNISERTAGNGGGGMWDVVLSSTVTENTFNIVQGTGVATLSLVLRSANGVLDAIAAGVVADNSTDDSAAIQSALNAFDHVLIPSGSNVAVGAMITINAGKLLEIGANVNIQRKTALTSDITPVIWVKETGSTLIGENRNDSMIATENKAPKGVVRIGLEDEDEVGRVVRHCRVEHLRVNGNTGDGQTSGDADIAVYIPTKAAEVNYYHVVNDIFCTDVNHGIFLHGESNGHQISNIFGESMGNSGVEGNLLYFRSGSDCSVSGVFMSGNGSSGTGANLLKFESLLTSRSTHNSFIGLVGEMGVNGKLVVSTETGSLAPVSNIISGVDNTGGLNVNTDFFDGNNTTLNDFPSTKGGYRFPSTPSVSSNLNTLDFYAEAQSYTLTPAIQPSNAAASQVTNITTSSWSRIGNRVSFELELDLTTLGTGNGDVQITNGLEFSAARDTIVNVGQFSGLGSTVVSISAMCKAGSKDIQLRAIASAATGDAIVDWATSAAANMAFTITGEYSV